MTLSDAAHPGHVYHSSELGMRAVGWYWVDEDGVAHGPMSHGNAMAAMEMAMAMGES